MKKTWIDKWCGQPWLHTTYFLGIVMANVLIINWSSWSIQQKLMGILTVFLPLHVFEELSWPNGFQFMMNKLIQKSDNPLAYPENKLTDMITNFGAEILFIVLTFLTPILGNKGVVFAAVFGIGETIAHTIFSIITLKYYRKKGKRTVYTPGFVTAWCLLLEVGIYSIYWTVTSGTFIASDLWGLLGVVFLIGFMIRLPFIISYKIKSTRFAYDDMGYFKKYEQTRT